MPFDTQALIHLHGHQRLNLNISHHGARTPDAYLTFIVGLSHIVVEEEMFVREAKRAVEKVPEADFQRIPPRAKFEFDSMPDAAQVGFTTRLRGGAPAVAHVNARAAQPYLQMQLGRVCVRAYDQLALIPFLHLFNVAAELAPNVFVQPVQLPPPRIAAPEAFFADESPEVLAEPVAPVGRRPEPVSAFSLARQSFARTTTGPTLD